MDKKKLLSPLHREAVPSLGCSLRDKRTQKKLSAKSMALAVGVPYDDYLAWEADTALPDVDGVMRLCDVLELKPLHVLRRIKETARGLLREALDEVSGQKHPMAARDWTDKSAPRPVGPHVNVPSALLRAIGVDNLAAAVAKLQAVSLQSPHEQQIWIDGTAVQISLDGEDQLEPLDL